MLRGGKLYDVLLVVERTRFNQSCALLDAALPLQPEVRPSAWCALLSKHTVTHASERYKEQEHELKKLMRTRVAGNISTQVVEDVNNTQKNSKQIQGSKKFRKP